MTRGLSDASERLIRFLARGSSRTRRDECGEPTASETGTVRFGGGRLETQVRLCAGRLPYLVILIDGYRKWDWLAQAVSRRLLEELATLDVQLNHDKTRWVNLARGESFHFLGFAFHRVKTRQGAWGVLYAPTLKARTALLSKLRDIFRRFRSQPVERLIALINPILRGWVNYFRVGHASRCFGYVKDWVEKKVRQQMMRARQRQGFGWKRWSRSWLYDQLGLYNGYRVVQPWAESAPSR